MPLSSYHQQYASQPDTEIAKRARVKEEELETIFRSLPLPEVREEVKIGVMGCGDQRFIALHRNIFSRLFGKPAHIYTFDISIEHLSGEDSVYQHDVILPLPHGPFDITYAHVLLKFIATEKQWDVIENSLAALANGGIAIHVFDHEEIEAAEILLPNGQYAVPLKRWEGKLQSLGVKYLEVPLRYGFALVLKK